MEYFPGAAPESPTAHSLLGERLQIDVAELILSHLAIRADRRRRQQLLNDGLTNMAIADDSADNLLVVRTTLTTTTCSGRRARTRKMTATMTAGAPAATKDVDADVSVTRHLRVRLPRTSAGARRGR